MPNMKSNYDFHWGNRLSVDQCRPTSADDIVGPVFRHSGQRWLPLVPVYFNSPSCNVMDPQPLLILHSHPFTVGSYL